MQFKNTMYKENRGADMVVEEKMIGNTKIKINDESVVTPKENALILENIARIAAANIRQYIGRR